MKKIFIVCTVFAILSSCKSEKKNISPVTYLNNKEQEKLKLDVVRYIEDLAKYANQQNKFDTIFDKEYQQKASKLELLFAFKQIESDTLYFAVCKIAPSLKLKKVSTCGKVVYDQNQKLAFYQEGFRTWKMEVPELKTKTEMLFQKYINDQDLSEFYTKNSKGKFIIEFPDDYNVFDTKSRTWKFLGNSELVN